MSREFGSEIPPVSDVSDKASPDDVPAEILCEEPPDPAIQEAVLHKIQETTEPVSTVFEDDVETLPSDTTPDNEALTLESVADLPEKSVPKTAHPLGDTATKATTELIEQEQEQTPEPEQSGPRRWLKRFTKDAGEASESSKAPRDNDSTPELQQGGEGNDGGKKPPRWGETGEGDEGGESDRAPDSNANEQLAHYLLDRFTGEGGEEAINRNPAQEINNAGKVMAALVKEGEIERFQGSLQELTANKDTQARILKTAVDHSNRDMLPPIFDTLDTISAIEISPETAAEVMGSVSEAIKREADAAEEPITPAWHHYGLNSENMLRKVGYGEPVDPEFIANVYRGTAYVDEDEETHAAQLTERITDFVTSPLGQERVPTREGTHIKGAQAAEGALKGLDALGLEDQEEGLVRKLMEQPTFSKTLYDHVSGQFADDQEKALRLYDTLQENRADLAHMAELDVDRAKYQVRNGAVDEALAFAEAHPGYEDRVEVTLDAVRSLHAEGETTRSLSLLEQTLNLDPRAVEMYEADDDAPDAEGYVMVVVSPDDLEAASQEADAQAMEEQLQLPTESELLHTRQQLLPEIAKTAAKTGAYDLAARALAQGAPAREDVWEIAEAVIKDGDIEQYVEATLRSEALHDHRKTAILDGTLQTLQVNKFTGGPSTLNPELREKIKDYAYQMCETGSPGYNNAAKLLIECGEYDAIHPNLVGREAARNALTTRIIEHKAVEGQIADILPLYVEHVNRIMPFEKVGVRQTIVQSALWHQDEASLRTVFEGLDGLEKRFYVRHALEVVGDRIIVPDWVLNEAFGDRPSPTDEVAEAVDEAKIVQDRTKKGR